MFETILIGMSNQKYTDYWMTSTNAKFYINHKSYQRHVAFNFTQLALNSLQPSGTSAQCYIGELK